MAGVTSHSSFASGWDWLTGVGSEMGCFKCAALIRAMLALSMRETKFTVKYLGVCVIHKKGRYKLGQEVVRSGCSV